MYRSYFKIQRFDEIKIGVIPVLDTGIQKYGVCIEVILKYNVLMRLLDSSVKHWNDKKTGIQKF
ncbi:hypothetical protein [Wolbachia endosymbiont of Cylisticus convexus]|uniref:hypothetical protein n=1 Tax=Wolbachia endosymbiont of Cylisticus convexus TaxID=118728 RepID=UPI0011C01951|nr:hypothetical protein [Wolbachia endosymbiont of Cylisticus convexus]